MSEAGRAVSDEGRTLRVGTIVLAGVLLTLAFMILRFPYERLADRITEGIEARSGARVQLGSVSLGLVRFAPGLVAESVRLQTPAGSRIEFDRVGVRPALSLSWLRARPALATEVRGLLGQGHGVLTLAEAIGFRGRLEGVQIGELPDELLRGPLLIEGTADADLDLTGDARETAGRVSFQAREGLLQHPELPLPVPYDRLDGDLELGGERMARVERLELASPLASGRLSGTVGRAASFDQAPLDLDIELTLSEAIRGSLTAQGVQVGRDGQMRLSVLGTPAKPIVR